MLTRGGDGTAPSCGNGDTGGGGGGGSMVLPCIGAPESTRHNQTYSTGRSTDATDWARHLFQPATATASVALATRASYGTVPRRPRTSLEIDRMAELLVLRLVHILGGMIWVGTGV